jgi:hypothetical protein
MRSSLIKMTAPSANSKLMPLASVNGPVKYVPAGTKTAPWPKDLRVAVKYLRQFAIAG